MGGTHGHVEFGMYPFASVAWAWDDLWRAVHERAPWLPATLTRTHDVHARWDDSECLVTHVCGAPFAADHTHHLRLVGAFELDLADAEPPGHYHSVLVSPHDVPLADLVGPLRHAVANSEDSLSGWLSLLAPTVGPGGSWPGRVTFSGAHLDSLRLLAAGGADLAAIDSWSLALISTEFPELVVGLRRVGVGPRIPTPAIAARSVLSNDQVAELRDAFRAALADPTTAEARHALHIAGFADNTLDDYRATLALVPST